MKRLLIVSFIMALAATSISAQTLEGLPHYMPEQKVSGTIRDFVFTLAA